MAARRITWEAQAGWLTRHVALGSGRGYTQRCGLELLDKVAWFLKVHPQKGVTADSLRRTLGGPPSTQLKVALGFLAARGLVCRAGKASYPASMTVYEDALEAYHFLAEAGG